MADCIFSEPYGQINGAIGKDKRYVCRQKTHRIFGMKIDGKGEIYKREPRNYKAFPIVGREKETVEKFQWAFRQMERELANPDHFAYWKQRFVRQVEHPDVEILDKRGRPKVYKDFKAYVRAMLMRGRYEIALVSE